MSEDHYSNRDKMSNPPYEGGGSLGALPLPGRTMPQFQTINPRPFGIESQPREFPARQATVEHPFQVLDASNDTDGVRVYVRPGFISSSLSYHAPPTGMELDDSLPEDKFYLTVAASGFVVLKFQITEDEDRIPSIDEITLTYETTMPADTATAQHLTVAVVTFADGAITHIFQNITSNLLHSVEFEPFSVPDYWRQLIGPASSSLL